MEFDIEKLATLIMKKGKQQKMERIELPNQDKIRTLGKKKTSKYVIILQTHIIKHEIKNVKKYLRRTRKLLETKLHRRNLIKLI